MKPEAQRIAIAEARGYLRNDELECWEKDGKSYFNEHPHHFNQIPDYLNDSDAMRDARKILTPLQKSTYARILTELTWQSEQPLYCAMDATAQQQAEAFLRTIGKWESPTV